MVSTAWSCDEFMYMDKATFAFTEFGVQVVQIGVRLRVFQVLVPMWSPIPVRKLVLRFAQFQHGKFQTKRVKIASSTCTCSILDSWKPFTDHDVLTPTPSRSA